MAYTRTGPFVLNSLPYFDTPAFLNGVEDGIVEAQTAVTVNLQTGAGYTAVAADAGKVIEMNNAGANAVTINGGVFSTGHVIEVCQVGAGATSIVQGSGMTLRNSTLAVSGQWKSLRVRFRSASEAVVE